MESLDAHRDTNADAVACILVQLGWAGSHVIAARVGRVIPRRDHLYAGHRIAVAPNDNLLIPLDSQTTHPANLSLDT